MKSEEQIKMVKRLVQSDRGMVSKRLEDPKMIDLLHACVGMGSESGEILDAFKATIFYGKKLDVINMKEELGDLCWYIGLAIISLREMGVDISWEKIWKANEDKLRKRYGEKFSSERAINRDLESERKILEGGSK